MNSKQWIHINRITALEWRPTSGQTIWYTVNSVLRGHSKKRSKIDSQDWLLLNAGRKYCRMLQKSILQYFRPALSHNLSLRSLFCLYLSDRFRQVILYVLKFRTLFSFCSHINSWLSGLESANCLSEESRPFFWQATSFRNFRTFTVLAG